MYKEENRNKMKVQNVNKSSKKTKKLIKKIFAEMLSEKRELGKISVSELCARADISRGTFYSHYDDIYGVAEDYENEIIDKFFSDSRLLSPVGVGDFIGSFFQYIMENNESYKLLCKSNDFMFAAKKLAAIAANKITELSRSDPKMKNKDFLEIEINIFIEGTICEYVKYCRGYSAITPQDLYDYTKQWYEDFIKRHYFAEK